jgi:hypothetical protein
MILQNVTFNIDSQQESTNSMSFLLDNISYCVPLVRGGMLEWILKKYIEEENFLSDVPDEFQDLADQKLFEKQLRNYATANERLAQYSLADGRDEVIETHLTGEQVWHDSEMNMVDETVNVVTVSAIEPLEATVEQTTYDEEGNSITTTIENPLITQDNQERAAAQAVVDATPQPVIDQYNS